MLERQVIRLSRWFLAAGTNSVRTSGVDEFVALLRDQQRKSEGRGILTCDNHISVLDEPLLWATLPKILFQDTYTTRWSLGASDILFKNAYVLSIDFSLLSSFFSKGQTLETLRGNGIFQPALDRAIDLLNDTNWVHLFPEGAVNLTRSTYMRRFKWGISRLFLEPKVMPIVVPIWLTGFDQIMPEHRRAPRILPRLGANLTVSFGRPIPDNVLRPYFESNTRLSTMNEENLIGSLPELPDSIPSDHLYPGIQASLHPDDNHTYAILRKKNLQNSATKAQSNLAWDLAKRSLHIARIS
ncbi:Lyso-phosphatidylcholine acyltransferase [Malassezia yamatoensis]|uniref:Tafazzin family protein n=1 Tax=Malassezia yamatoensis TaxID=253288 RepID=A0AAJ6CGM7_9BASI|nr:Lyso-phosphatidylcholine acyltransferase [Malassezia yamatoensis]